MERRRRARGTPPGRRSWRAARRASAQDGLCPLVDPAIAVVADLLRGQLERARSANTAYLRNASGSGVPSRTGQHEHALRHRRLEPLGEHEVDQRSGALRVLRARRARPRARSGGSSCRRRRRSGPSSGASSRTSPRPPGSSRTRRRSAACPCCRRRRRTAPCTPPPSRRRRARRSSAAAASSPASPCSPKLGDGGEHEGQPGRRGGRVLDDEQLAVARAASGRRASCGGATPCEANHVRCRR